MGDSIENITNVSGVPTANTIDRPRYAPAGDDLAQGGQWPLHDRHPVLVVLDERAATQYGVQGGRLRDAARLSGISEAIGHVLGVDDTAGSPGGVRAVTDDGLDPEPVRDGLRPASRGQGRARNR